MRGDIGQLKRCRVQTIQQRTRRRENRGDGHRGLAPAEEPAALETAQNEGAAERKLAEQVAVKVATIDESGPDDVRLVALGALEPASTEETVRKLSQIALDPSQ